MNKHGFISIGFLLFLFIIAAAGGLYLFRGYTLPSRQNIEVKQMEAKGKKTYKDPAHAFRFSYTDLFTVREGENPDFQQGNFLKVDGSARTPFPVQVIAMLSRETYPGTNFSGAWFAVAFSPAIADQEDCRRFMAQGKPERMIYTQTIQGITWFRDITESGAAGTKVNSQVYHVLHNGICYEVSLNLATSNISFYKPGTMKAVDEAEIWRKLNEIFDTFRFVK